MQEARRDNDGMPKVHAMVYDLATGELKKLDVDVKEKLRKYNDVYAYKLGDN